MRIKVIYRKNLKMSEGKLAAQVAHAVKYLVYNNEEALDYNIAVLGVSDKKFAELSDAHITVDCDIWIQVDKGLTEIPAGTETCAAWIETE
jgi:peptidyl-tRNA hydrolase